MTDDQNLDAINNQLIEMMRDCYLQQIIMESTRARGSNIPSLLDLVFYYNEDQICKLEYLSPLGKSDHCILNFVYCIKKGTVALKGHLGFHDT